MADPNDPNSLQNYAAQVQAAAPLGTYPPPVPAPPQPSYSARVLAAMGVPEWKKLVDKGSQAALDLAHKEEAGARALGYGPQPGPTNGPYSPHVNWTPPPVQTPGEAGRQGLKEYARDVAPLLLGPFALPGEVATHLPGPKEGREKAGKVVEGVKRYVDPASVNPVSTPDEGQVEGIHYRQPTASPSPGGGGGGYVAPHWQNVMEPGAAQQLAAANELGEEGLQEKTQAESVQQKELGEAHQGAAHQLEDLANEGKHAEERRQDVIQRKLGQLQAMSNAIAEQRIDPERIWHERGTFRTVLSKIGLVLGAGIGAVTGHNPAKDIIDDEITRDIDAQKFNIAQRAGGVERSAGLLGQLMKSYGNITEAEAAARVLYRESALARLDALTANTQSPIVEANGKLLRADMERKLALERNQFIRLVGGGGGASAASNVDRGLVVQLPDGRTVIARTAQEAEKLRLKASAYKKVVSLTDTIDYARQHPFDVAAQTKAATAKENLGPAINQLHGYERYTEVDEKKYARQIGPAGSMAPWNIVTNAVTGGARMQAVRDQAREEYESGVTSQIPPETEQAIEPDKKGRPEETTTITGWAGPSKSPAPMPKNYRKAGQ